MTLLSRALDALFEGLPGRARVVDVSGTVVRSNERAAASDEQAGVATAGFAPRDATALTLRRLWELERPTRAGARAPLPFVETPAMRALAGIAVHDETLGVRRRGEVARVRTTAMPIRDDEGSVLGALLVEEDARDEPAADRVSADDLEADDLEGAEHERFMTASAKLAAGIMHDVNNVLNAVMGAAFLLKHNAESPDAVRDYAERIREAAESGAEMATRIARFVRQEPLPESAAAHVNLSALVNEVLNEVVDAVRDGIGPDGAREQLSVVRDIEGDVHVRGLADELRAAVRNVVRNAIEAMPTGGKIDVIVRSDSHDAMVTIGDSGPGMRDAVARRAMEPFFSTKGSTKAGMGLAESYGIVRRHGGRIGLRSTPGTGTIVTLHLPLATAASASGQGTVPAAKQGDDAIASGAGGANAPLHVLVVEDDDAGREFLRRILRAEGHAVDVVGNCADARERLAVALESPYHVMLTDVTLPDGSGWELASYARAQVPSLRIGVITGWEEATRRPESGDVEFVMRKPLRAAELLAMIADRTASTTSG